MSDYKNFDVEKAYELVDLYRSRQRFCRAGFVSRLCSIQNGRKSSIVGISLLIQDPLTKEATESVLKDLGYKLDCYHTHPKRSSVYIRFITDDSKLPTEG